MGLTLMILAIIVVVVIVGLVVFLQYRKVLREAKNYERGLKMMPLRIHLPPPSEDKNSDSRDDRDLTQEVVSQAQVMYNILASVITKGLKSKVYGQRHLSFEFVAQGGLVYFYVVVPIVLVDVIRQAIGAAYPTARLEELEDQNIFNPTGMMAGTMGGEFTLKKEPAYPIATYEESKRDASIAILNALSAATKEEGVAVQIMIRPASAGWVTNSISTANGIRKHKYKVGYGGSKFGFKPGELLEALWKPPEYSKEAKTQEQQLNSLEQSVVDAIENKTRYPGFETLIRVVASSNQPARAQVLVSNVVSAFALFDSNANNGFKWTPSKDVDELVTAYLFRFFPQEVNDNILNAVELATIFHLPDQESIPTSQVKRQEIKQVDGPTETMDQGLLIGYNEFRGVRKPIRISENDRRRHLYMIGQTGTGKSKFLENLAYQDIMDGRGLAFIDPHGDSAEALLGVIPKERIEDVVYFNPSDLDNPIALNLFDVKTDDQKDFVVQETLAMLYRLYDPGHTGIIGPRFEAWYRNGALTVMADPNGSSFLDVQQVFVDQSFADQKIKHLTSKPVLDFWNKEMAQTSSNDKSEMLGWFASKFGAFLTNDMMRNIIGQTTTGIDIREIMDNKKILIVNLSKGNTGELNAQLLGMIFVMKLQVAAMSRADIPENERSDFTAYVDEFQNFATDSFESILSEARKYRLSLALANQFMTQLTDKIREAILGNIGTVVSGRIGITDAEILQKKFQPVFDAEDLTRLPNFQSITSVMINNVPSSPFSMAFTPVMVHPNRQLSDAIKKLSAAKYGRPRGEVEQEIFARLASGDTARRAKEEELKQMQMARMQAMRGGQPYQQPGQDTATVSTAPIASPPKKSFLDDWLAKRQQIPTQKLPANPVTTPTATAAPQPPAQPPENSAAPTPPTPSTPPKPYPVDEGRLHIKNTGDEDNSGEVHLKLR